MRNTLPALIAVLLCGCATYEQDPLAARGNKTPMPQGELQVEIQSAAEDIFSVDGTASFDVEGMASSIGGVRYLDMMLVMDTSLSLQKTDPDDYRSQGAIGLVRNLSPKSDTKIGVVSFNNEIELVQPMTSNRDDVVKALRELKRAGKTDIAAGIRAAIAELDQSGRPDSSRVIMLFTDGKSNKKKALAATQEAQLAGITIQTLLLGSNVKGASMLDEIASGTGGSFVQVTDPTMLPEAFLNLRTTGVDRVTLSVNGSEPFAARLAGGTFSGTVPLELGENRIVARATSLDDRTRDSFITVNVRDASCAALEVAAVKDGRPVLSLNDRAVEIVVDASRSMWGRMDGQPKMVVAKDILHDVATWLPEDQLALRAYGSTTASENNNCADSTLLVPFGEDNRDPIRAAIDGLKPKGQTPIAYALNQAAADFDAAAEDRAVVLVTDGIESCGGDPVAAARHLRDQDIMVHLIGFGLGNAADEDAESLQAVADASGGRYLTAGSAEELKEALAATVGTPYRVFKGNVEVANGSLGSDEPIYLPSGQYRVELDSSPPQTVEVTLQPRDRTTLTLAKEAGVMSHFEQRNQMAYQSCEDAYARMRRLTDSEESDPVQTATY